MRERILSETHRPNQCHVRSDNEAWTDVQVDVQRACVVGFRGHVRVGKGLTNMSQRFYIPVAELRMRSGCKPCSANDPYTSREHEASPWHVQGRMLSIMFQCQEKDENNAYREQHSVASVHGRRCKPRSNMDVPIKPRTAQITHLSSALSPQSVQMPQTL